MPELPPELPAFVQACRDYRAKLKAVAIDVKSLRHHSLAGCATIGQGGIDEIDANITLAYRHLEDAAMRLGKAIQAFDGGKSVYPE